MNPQFFPVVVSEAVSKPECSVAFFFENYPSFRCWQQLGFAGGQRINNESRNFRPKPKSLAALNEWAKCWCSPFVDLAVVWSRLTVASSSQIEQTQTATYHWMNWWSNGGIVHSCWVVMCYLSWWIVEDYAVAAALALTILDKQIGRFPLCHSPKRVKLSRSIFRLIYSIQFPLQNNFPIQKHISRTLAMLTPRRRVFFVAGWNQEW